MPNVSLAATNFPAGSPIANGVADLNIEWPELVWAAISIGKASLQHIIQHGRYSIFEILYRAAIIYSNLLETADGRFARSAVYEGLDPSEKGAISYFLGMALTKAFAWKRLGIPWLMHVDVYREQFELDLQRQGERPDLFGQDAQGRWIVAESKGRSNGHDPSALAKAKTQAQRVLSIGDVAPFMSLGVVTSFAGGRLSIAADDPPTKKGPRSLKWNVSPQSFREAYYRPLQAAVEEEPSQVEIVRNRRIRTIRSDSADIVVGLDEQRVQMQGAALPDFQNDQEQIGYDESEYLGGDGIFVRLGPSWNSALMRLQPQQRVVQN